ncbi:GNAT family N-acetyltransferase [Aquimarina sp. D1M17]|uniref:GNAT family N-acetyltransferase n=1 Tax=Aquimarina acroporae TaxID=2937283 RepID=UPI0020BE903C|nr:GNAT family N-acetyltransferase [Aquimarina acroporae]MCK8521322.1 GNAT family N-acetyltransferase [Aquimarina acroporae]
MATIEKTNILFSRYIEDLGELQIRSFQPENDIKTIHDWVNRPYAKYWGMQNSSLYQVESEYRDLEANIHHHVVIGILNEIPMFLMEFYDPEYDTIAEHYDVLDGDIGMHILVAPVKKKIPGFTWNVFTTVMDFLFSKADAKRVVVEPDISNEKIHVLNKKAGFQYIKKIQLPHKIAQLAICARENYKRIPSPTEIDITMHSMSDNLVLSNHTAHLNPNVWAIVNRRLIRKAISEFAHELLLELELIGHNENWDLYKLYTDSEEISYYFEAKTQALDHLHINGISIKKNQQGKETELDALDFILELKNTLGIPENMLPTYMEEITSTLYGAAYKHKHEKYSAASLTNANFQEVEKAMSEGHPCFVANNGRIGFNSKQYQHFAPEIRTTFSLVWIAAHITKAEFHSTPSYNYEKFIINELGEDVYKKFAEKLNAQGLSPLDYIFIPIHPWQWENKISTIFAQDIAQQYIILLGEGKDQYAAQQSIRTLFNTSNPYKLYTKTSLSILNMGFMRGLSPYYMGSTPVITEWISELLDNDEFLQKIGFTMLGEVATVGYRNRYYETLGKTEAHNKMLSALWRESPYTKINESQKLMTMAALLHVDSKGEALAVELIKKSGVTVEIWLEHYLTAYLTPLLHCLYEYELVFMPHGENLILVLDNYIPTKVIMKDITEEIAIFDDKRILPEKAKRLYVDTNDEIKALAILTDVFDCFFRFLSDILVYQGGYDESVLWNKVAQCILKYQDANKHLSDKFEKIDLFAPEFKRCCLNRLQLLNTKHMLNLADPVESLQFMGTIKNPIAQYKDRSFLTQSSVDNATE